MNKEIIRNVRLGFFVLAGVSLLIFGLYSIGKNKNVFGKSVRLISIFYDVNGLNAGSNVRYSGIDIGTVDKIEIINDTAIKIEMLIDEKVIMYIRKNSIASIGTDGLMGNKIINIAPGTTVAPLVMNDDTISTLRGVNTDEMLRTLDKTNYNISIISSNIRRISEDVTNSHGLLYKVVMDTVLARNMDATFNSLKTVSNNLQATSDYLYSIASDLKNGKGTLGMILSDTSMASDLRIAMKNITEGTNKFNALSTELNVTVAKINSGNGAVSVLINDSLLKADLVKTISNLESASKKLDDDMEGLKHSFLLRGYFRDVEREKAKEEKKKNAK